MKLTDTRPKRPESLCCPWFGSDDCICPPGTPGPVDTEAQFSEMNEFDRDVALLRLIASLSLIYEALEERIQTLELSGEV